MEFTFAVDFTISKDLFNLKNDILTIELQQRQLDIFQRALLYICITWSTILVLKVVPTVAKQYLWRGFTFFYQKLIKFLCIFKEVKTKSYLFLTHLTPNRIYIFCNFNISKDSFTIVLKLIYRATKLRQRPKFDAFQKTLFYTLLWSTNLVLKVVSIGAGQDLWRIVTFIYKKTCHFWSFYTFLNKQTKKTFR